MAQISDLVAMVAARIPEAPDPVIEDSVRYAFHEFCEKTKVWQEVVGPINTVADFQYFSLGDFGSGGGFIYDMRDVSVDGHELEYGDRNRAVQLKLIGKRGRPELYYRVPGEAMILYPTPDRAYPITGTAFLVPSVATQRVPNFLMTRFGRGLMHGAMFHLANMKRKPWTDPEMAADSLMMYQSSLSDATEYANGTHHHKTRVTAYGGL